MNKFKHELLDVKDGEIIKIGEKVLYNCDGVQQADEGIKRFNKNKIIGKESFRMSNSLNIVENKPYKLCPDSIGYFQSVSNSMTQQNFLMFHSHPIGGGTSTRAFFPENFDNAMSYIAVRLLTKSTWINQRDSYIQPKISE